jgi:recombination protein RecA
MAAPKKAKQGDLNIPAALEAWLKKTEGASLMSEWSGEGYEVFSTGDLLVDSVVTGIGGFPRGRIVEIYGPESSGKTTMAVQTCVSAQNSGHYVCYVDVEHAFDVGYFVALGGDPKKLVFAQPSSGEEAFQTAIDACDSGLFGVVVVDSVAALTPQAELDGEMSKEFMGLQPRLMGKGLRKIKATAHESNTLVIFINQEREKIGVMFGSNKTTPGGKALKFYASMRLELTNMGKVKEGDSTVGSRIRVRAVKNKCARPFREAVTTVRYGKGFDQTLALFELAIENDLGVKQVKGAKYLVGSTEVTGRAKAIAAFGEDIFLLSDVKEKVLALSASGNLKIPSGDND